MQRAPIRPLILALLLAAAALGLARRRPSTPAVSSEPAALDSTVTDARPHRRSHRGHRRPVALAAALRRRATPRTQSSSRRALAWPAARLTVFARSLAGGFVKGAEEAGAAFVFLDTFDGAPANPHPDYFRDRWDVTLDGSRNGSMHFTPIEAHHGLNCGGIPGTHRITEFDQSVYLCNNHWMFAIGAIDSFPVTALTPGALLDFSSGPAKATFDMTTSRGSDREWIEFWLTPARQAGRADFDRHQTEPNSQGVDQPRDSVGLRMENPSHFDAYVTRDNVSQKIATGPNWHSFLTPSAVRRDAFELEISQSRVRLCMPTFNRCLIDSPISPPLAWDNATLQIVVYAYNSPKGSCVDLCVDSDRSNTWHIDNVRLEPAIPLTIVRSTRQFARPQSAVQERFDFVSAAPAHSFLRFTAGGGSLAAQEFSVDGGKSWQKAESRPKQNGLVAGEHATTFMVAISPGADHVIFRNIPFNRTVRDVTIWSLSGAPPSPIATATSAPAPPTPVAKTSTPTATAASTSTPTAKPEPTATPRPEATPTRTPVPATPTRTSTPDPTPLPTPTPAPAPAEPTAWTTSATVHPVSFDDRTHQISVSVAANRAVDVLVDIEVSDSSGRGVFQLFFDNQHLEADAPRTYSAEWKPAASASGTYTVRIGVFAPGWGGGLYHWNGAAATITLGSGERYVIAGGAGLPSMAVAPPARMRREPAPGASLREGGAQPGGRWMLGRVDWRLTDTPEAGAKRLGIGHSRERPARLNLRPVILGRSALGA